MHDRDGEEFRLRSIERSLERIESLLRELLRKQITGFRLFQLKGDLEMPITGINVGSSGAFQIGLVPPNGVPLQSGPTVTTDDATVSLGAVDTNLQFTASVPASDTAVSFNITVSGVNGAGVAISHVFNVPIIQAPPAQVSDFSLNQLS